MTTEARPGQLVVHLKWTEADGTPQQEMFGPWAPADDDSHLEQITAFMRDWNRLVGDRAEDAVMWAVQDPDEWVRERELASPPDLRLSRAFPQVAFHPWPGCLPPPSSAEVREVGYAWQWLIANGLYKDLLAAVVALAVTRIAAWCPLRRLRRIEDLLNADSPGGLNEVIRALRGEPGGKDEDEADIHIHPHGVRLPPPPMPPHHVR